MPSPVVRLTEAARNAANQLSAHMLRVARPFFWHIGLRRGGVPRGATAFILQFEERYVAVTANHVLDQYLSARADERIICQLGTCQVWPEKTLIAQSKRLDIATFEIEQRQLRDIKADTIDCRRGGWPPPDPVEGDTITLTGFLDEHRTEFARGRYTMEAWGAHGIADAVTERDIVTIYEPDRVLGTSPVIPKPPLGFNMSGCSGGPVFLVKTVNGLLRWFPAGLIYKGPDGKAEGDFASFDRIHVRRLHFLKSDGAIDDPELGWLP